MTEFGFLSAVDDVELREEIRSVLRQLQLLSESAAVPTERAAPSSEKPLGPPGFAGLSAAVCPKESRSLYEHFAWRFDQSVANGASRKRLWFLLWEAEEALRSRTVPPTVHEREERVALVLTRADETALTKLILETDEGEHAFRVHLRRSLPMGWVEKIREDDGRDPIYGQRRPQWRKLDEQEKLDVVHGLAARTLTQADAAKMLGIGLRTVKEYWPSRAAA